MTISDALQLVGGLAGIAALAKVGLDHLHARKTVKLDLHKLANEVAGEMLQEARTDRAELRARIDQLANKSDRLLTELADTHEKLRNKERELIDTERALLVAEAEGHRKEREILRLKTRIADLEATIAELQEQIRQLATALQDCAHDCTGARSRGNIQADT